MTFRWTQWIACLLALGAADAVAQMADDCAGDTVLIIGVSPATFDDGRETEVTVTVAYELVSFDEAEVQLGANDLHPQGFGHFAFTKVKKGTGTITLRENLCPGIGARPRPRASPPSSRVVTTR